MHFHQLKAHGEPNVFAVTRSDTDPSCLRVGGDEINRDARGAAAEILRLYQGHIMHRREGA
jgi:hypothetical protein